MLINPEDHKITLAVRFKFKASNNEAEYEVLVAGLQLASHLKIERLKIFSDSQLVVGQVKEEYQARGERMGAYLRKVKEELAKFKSYEIQQVPRAENTNADALAKLASLKDLDLVRVVPIEELERPTIDEAVEVLTIQAAGNWMTPLVRYLTNAELPNDRDEARRIRQEYYWPTLKKDAFQYARCCDKCQRYATIPRAPPENLTSILSPWPFTKWGIDLIGPLHLALISLKFAIVIVDYYTKWAEAKALTSTTEAACTSFIWNNIVLEAINKILKYTLKKKLDSLKGKWAEELLNVLWAYRTTSRTTTDETSLSMAYGVKTVLIVEIEMPTLRTVMNNDDINIEAMNGELDLLEEKRLDSQLRLAAYQRRTSRYFDKKVKRRRFVPENLT
ncbi:uncharacterized protein LOC112093216 [Morus notabilis]|uniref:uncharacterized protein LOC112093216 n=1 Tax=Morus notabilis TaxID=981085 RepID=UPI000CED4020|nr:uncharacterized protein LOC112093216 [Morus notabilis]